MHYFFDNSISWRLVEMLRALEVEATALREELPQDTTDQKIFKELEGRDSVFVATDFKQLTRAHEARALKSAGVSAIYIARFWGKMQFWDQATWHVRRWPGIDGFISVAERGTIAEVSQSGRASIHPL